MIKLVQWVERLLKSIGLVRAYDDEDVMSASTEDAARTHNSLIESLHASIQKRVQGNEALRQSIMIAKERTSAFGALEHRIKGSRK
jgi:predicted component of type VI protein secretion system